jgi:surface protein
MNQYDKVIYLSLKNNINEKKNIGTIISFIRKPFKDRKELKTAVDKWVKNDSKDRKNLINIYGPIEYWDVSNVTDMSNLFYDCNIFNEDISRWDVSNVTDMCGMFSYCFNFNGNISRWNLSNVKNMSYMFSFCKTFNQDISEWDLSTVTDMKSIFYECISLDLNFKCKEIN